MGDESLFELTHGFGLSGTMNDSGKFPRKLKPAGIIIDQLRKSSEWGKEDDSLILQKNVKVAEAVCPET